MVQKRNRFGFLIFAFFVLFTAQIAFVIATESDGGGAAPGPVAEGSICAKPRERGDSESCSAPSPGRRYFFDHQATHHCQPFQYNGCGGNENRFLTLEECRKQCAASSEAGGGGSSKPHGATAPVLPVPKCPGGVRAAVRGEDASVLKCSSADGDSSCPSDYSCNAEMNACCPKAKESVCLLAYDTGRYVAAGSHTARYFYNPAVSNCQLFSYYGALGNANNFETYSECIKYCKGVVNVSTTRQKSPVAVQNHVAQKQSSAKQPPPKPVVELKRDERPSAVASATVVARECFHGNTWKMIVGK